MILIYYKIGDKINDTRDGSMFQIKKVSGSESGFELSILYSYSIKSAFAFVSGLKCGKRWHLDPISSISDPNPSLLGGWEAAARGGLARTPIHKVRPRSSTGSGPLVVAYQYSHHSPSTISASNRSSQRHVTPLRCRERHALSWSWPGHGAGPGRTRGAGRPEVLAG